MPKIHPRPKLKSEGYPIANDALAEQFAAAANRKDDERFKSSKHRVAVVIGESALCAALPFIPEETIVVADKMPNMLWFMSQYRDSLRRSSNAAEWRNDINGSFRLYSGRPNSTYLQSRLDEQIGDWRFANLTHPVTDRKHFLASQQAARDKAIIPYFIDIGSMEAVSKFNRLLRASNAVITFLNHTNVIQFSGKSAHEMLDPLDVLPLAPQLPIFASSSHGYAYYEETNLDLLEPIGPFSSVDDYRAYYDVAS